MSDSSGTGDVTDVAGRLHVVGGEVSALLAGLIARLGRPVRSQDRRRIAGDVERVTSELAAVVREAEIVLQHTPTSLPAPHTGIEGPGDDLAAIAAAQAAVDRTRDQLHAAVEHAHAAGASWRRIGHILGIAGQTAHKRFDPAARRRHAAYMRERARRARNDTSRDGAERIDGEQVGDELGRGVQVGDGLGRGEQVGDELGGR